jgi:SWI/SNF-related matrix-associated actin-dependent regulator of chromatin subfamily A member 5
MEQPQIQTSLQLSLDEKLQNLISQAETYAKHLFLMNKLEGPAGYQKRRRINQEEYESSSYSLMIRQPSILIGSLRTYQLDGVNWLISLFRAGINGILADEMGLGKTIQTIAFLSFLYEVEEIQGPHLVVVPKSTLGNWVKEFESWCPIIKTLKLVAAKPFREEIIQNSLVPGQFDVCITSYEGITLCYSSLRKFNWNFLIIDEAQKIKNDESNLSLLIRKLSSKNRLLITGTPLQNNLHELWSLLNFLLPKIFSSSSDFDEWFRLGAEEGLSESEIEKKNVRMVQLLHKVLKPFILRRTKSEVETAIPPKKEILVTIKMTPLQKDLYRKILCNELYKKDSKCHYLNVVMQLRKVCNHPYLFPGVEDEKAPDLAEHLITNSGKMKIIDQLLPKLKESRSQVLIFTQMTMMLDILEDYCNFRGFSYCRLDGMTDIYEREKMIALFTEPQSSYFIFLLSTRAGGLGINLASADTVIIYDSDWNPQVDLQAMDRAHRIGQSKQVNVYRLVTRDSLEERIIERQCLRLKLDSLIIQTGRLVPGHKSLNKEELQEMLHFGADQIFSTQNDDTEVNEEDLELMLHRGEQKIKKINEELEIQLAKRRNLIEFESKIDMWNFESIDYSKKRKEDSKDVLNKIVQERLSNDPDERRDKKNLVVYNVESKNLKVKEFKPAADFKFFQSRERLLILQEKEFRKEILDDEKEELEKLMRTGFDWKKKEYWAFVKGCEMYGKHAFSLISEMVGSKNEEEVRAYSEVFWNRLHELADKEKIVKNIEKRESLLEKYKNTQSLVDNKFLTYKDPWRELNFDSSISHKSKVFTQENDRHLLCYVKLVGYGNWEALRQRIRRSEFFKLDYMIRSRTSNELQRRVDFLVKQLEKESEEKIFDLGKRKKEPDDDPKLEKLMKIDQVD